MDGLPCISEADFARACRELEPELLRCRVDSRYVEQNGVKCLIIRRSARDLAPDMSRTHYTGAPPPTEEEEHEMSLAEERDPARWDVPELHPWTVSVEYHILLSATYRVPVLYLQTLYPLGETAEPKLEHVLEHLVPASYRAQVESVGVMGAISATHHPMHGLSFYTVHPCNTADAMREILDGKSPSPPEYLQIWLGLVGPTVGLQLPKEIAVGIPTHAA